jgi:hypothetical protein
MSGIVHAILAQRQQRAPLAPLLQSMDACSKAVGWAADIACDEHAWRACPRADWLLWLATRLSVDRRLVVAAACGCAMTVLPLAHEQDLETCAHAIATALRWCDGTATHQEVASAYDSAYAAAYAAAHSAANAANAAANANAVYATVYATAYAYAANAAYAAYDAAYAADAAAYADRAAHHALMADVVRAVIPWWVVADALAEHRRAA